MNDLFMALVRYDELGWIHWPNGIAAYYDPGAISLRTSETLCYCFLEQPGQESLMVWSSEDCSLNRQGANRALRKLDQRRLQNENNLPADFPAGIAPEMHDIAQTLFRLQYFEPEHPFINQMLKLVRAGRTLSSKQCQVVSTIQRELGNLETMRWRHQQRWRLLKLAELDLKPRDRETVARFLKHIRDLHGRQTAVITAIEQQYWSQRREQTLKRAERVRAIVISEISD